MTLNPIKRAEERLANADTAHEVVAFNRYMRVMDRVDRFKRTARLTAAIITAPVWVPVYLYHVACQARDDIHD